MVPLVAMLLIPFTGMVAFAIDIAWIVQSRSDLQSAADAAALAGAEQLMNGFVQYSLPGQTQKSTILTTAETSAKTYAKNFASYNTAGGVSSLKLNDADIEFGFTDANNNYTAAQSYTGFPNTVKVTMRLDSSANGSLKLFFAPIFGQNSSNVQASAAATIYTANIISFQSKPGTSTGVLPMTLDVNAWNAYIQSGVSSDGTTHSSANGAPQMQVYPSPNLAPGNFGMLSLNDSSNASSDISTWITSGMSSSDITALQSANLLPLASPNPGLWDWKGSPGFKASDVNSLHSQPELSHAGLRAGRGGAWIDIRSRARHGVPGNGQERRSGRRRRRRRRSERLLQSREVRRRAGHNRGQVKGRVCATGGRAGADRPVRFLDSRARRNDEHVHDNFHDPETDAVRFDPAYLRFSSLSDPIEQSTALRSGWKA